MRQQKQHEIAGFAAWLTRMHPGWMETFAPAARRRGWAYFASMPMSCTSKTRVAWAGMVGLLWSP